MVTKYGVVGYASVYEYYAYPSHIRPRVSQVVILPPFRCIGLCSKLLNSVYSYYQTNRKVVDITGEFAFKLNLLSYGHVFLGNLFVYISVCCMTPKWKIAERHLVYALPEKLTISFRSTIN